MMFWAYLCFLSSPKEHKAIGIVNKYLWQPGLFSSRVSRHVLYPSGFERSYFCFDFDFAYSKYVNKVESASTFYGS